MPCAQVCDRRLETSVRMKIMWLIMAIGIGQGQLEPITELFGRDSGLRIVRANGEYLEEFYARDGQGKMRLVLVSPTHPAAKPQAPTDRVSALSHGSSALFTTSPTFRFDGYQKLASGGGHDIVLTRKSSDGAFEKRIHVPETGNVFEIETRVQFADPKPMIQYFLDSYAFAPDGSAVRPDTTFAPGLRKHPGNVIGDHFFRAPVVMAQHGNLAALLMPDLDSLAANRPIPTIIDLDAASGVNGSTLLSYGYCNHQLSGHVNFTTDSSMVRRVPQELNLKMQLRVDAQAKPHAAYETANDYLWERYGSANFKKVLPQAMPFSGYAGACYPAVMKEQYGENKLGWSERDLDKPNAAQKETEAESGHRAGPPEDAEVGWIPAGWGFTEGWVSWQCWFNQLRSAWGMRWWAERGADRELKEKSEKMLNLALAAPMDRGAVPTTYLGRENKWRGCLIMPTKDCYYDLPSMAWKGIWMLKWLEFPDCPRKDEILKQCREMGDLMVRMQNSDGSYPSWLDKKLAPVAVLDHSAQSSLPAWFLFELDQKLNTGRPLPYRDSAIRASNFLMKEVVDQQRYYDFETFFSCSPKECKADGKVDDESMHDAHTLQPPQNTLCMQWTAEALRAANHATQKPEYMEGALKALNMMMLYQNVWPISYRQVAYTYGGFGVQNSDGEYNDARQAQFGCTLMDFGSELGRKDLFERGIAATRAALTLINHPLHIGNDIYPDPNYPYGLEPENNGHGGTDQQNGRTGFDWGEGSGLASMAYALAKYGGVYVDDKHGWAVGIDGVTTNDNGSKVTATMSTFFVPWTGDQSVAVKFASGKPSQTVVAEAPLQIRRIDPVWEDGKLTLVAVPSWTGPAKEFKGTFLVDGGRSIDAKLGSRGFEATVDPKAIRGGLIGFKGTFGGQPIASPEFAVRVDPTFEFDGWTLPAGWRSTGDFPELPTHSDRFDFNNGGKPFIGTCEDGKGGYDDRYTGSITSPLFMSTGNKMTLMVGGGSGKDTYVELISAHGEPLLIARGKDRERMEAVEWDLTPYVGQMLRVRIVDQATGGWGHINVGKIVVGG